MSRASELRSRFLHYHHEPPVTPTHGILTMPNAWDIGSSKVLVTMGARALATTSSGHAASLGRMDGSVTRDEMIDHARVLSNEVDVPISVDAEDCFADDVAGVRDTVALLAETDVAGLSIEDYDPKAGTIRDLATAVERVAAAKEAGGDLVVTARAENLIRGVDDLSDTIDRLIAYRNAGADVVYAPGLVTIEGIRRVVESVDAPVNVLALPAAPSIPELAEAGVARASVGGNFAWAAYGSLADAAGEWFTTGTSGYAQRILGVDVRRAAFGAGSTPDGSPRFQVR